MNTQQDYCLWKSRKKLCVVSKPKITGLLETILKKYCLLFHNVSPKFIHRKVFCNKPFSSPWYCLRTTNKPYIMTQETSAPKQNRLDQNTALAEPLETAWYWSQKMFVCTCVENSGKYFKGSQASYAWTGIIRVKWDESFNYSYRLKFSYMSTSQLPATGHLDHSSKTEDNVKCLCQSPGLAVKTQIWLENITCSVMVLEDNKVLNS